ncbi:MAG: hypothetical protein GXO71_03610 [Caldiserica bacterium]|nr:hypothetical protein [Caldisericota bacterium]
MKIKEFFITRYGPLHNLGPFRLNSFNLFFGKNENGKTLTIDALVKLLLKNIRGFENIERVEERPAGYVVVENEEGKEFKLPEKGDLTKIARLSTEECRNIFIIRNSELSIGRDEVAFYTNITDRLTGLRTEAIAAIKKELQKIGKLTRPDSGGGLSSSREFGHIKLRIEDADKLIERINEFQKVLQRERFDELEIESVNIKEEIEKLKQEIKTLETARRRAIYEKGKEALNRLRKAREDYRELELYSEEEGQLWRDHEGKIQEYVERREKLAADLKEKEAELNKIEDELSGKETDFKIIEEKKKIVEEIEREVREVIKREPEYEEKKIALEKITSKAEEQEKEFRLREKRKEAIDREIKPYVEEYRRKKEALALQEHRNSFFARSLIVSLFLLGISLTGSIIKNLLIFYVFSGLFLIVSVVFWILRFQSIRHNSELNKLMAALRLEGKKVSLPGETFEEISVSLQRLEEEYALLKEEVERTRKERSEKESEFKFLRDKIKESRDKISQLSETLGWERKEIKKYLFDVAQFQEAYLRENNQLRALTASKQALEQAIAELKEKSIPAAQEAIKKARAKIEEIIKKSGEESLQGYVQKVHLKREKLEEEKRCRSILESLFPPANESLSRPEIISYWEEEISALEEYRDKCQGIEYDDKNFAQLKEVLNSEEMQLEALKAKMKQFQRSLEDIEREANKILGLEADYISCKTCGDLKVIKEKLEEFVREHRENRENVLKVMEIFERIEGEEQRKISELFGKDSPVSDYFSEITSGLYREVLFNQENETIEVIHGDGHRLEANKLSGGAYDQLYLSIRLTLGEKLLKGVKGFFILDDPFVKADSERLRRQVEVLKRISGRGWQIIYFSAKEEIKKALIGDIESGRVNYIDVPGISK